MMYMNTPTWLSHTSVDFPQSIIRFIKDCDNSVPLRGSGRIRTDESTALQAATLGRSVTEPDKSSIQRVQLPRIGSPPTTSYIFRSIKPSSVEVLRSHASFTNQLAIPLAIIGRTFVLQEGIEPSLPGYSQCASIHYTATCFGQVSSH